MEVKEAKGPFYTIVKDNHGAEAVVNYSDLGDHTITYKDVDGNEFFHECYDSAPIEVVERAAIDWAEGKRKIA